MNWYKTSQANANVTVSIDKYVESLKIQLYDLSAYVMSEQDRIARMNVNVNSYISQFQSFGLPAEMITELQNAFTQKDDRLISSLGTRIYDYVLKDQKGKIGWEQQQKYFQAARSLHDVAEQIRQSRPNHKAFDENAVGKMIDDLSQKTTVEMQQIADLVRSAVPRVQDWGGYQIVVEARTVDKEDNFMEPQSTSSVRFAKTYLDFMLYRDGQKIIIDDIVDGAEGNDFFADDRMRANYFNLIKEIQEPGSTQKEEKAIRLYTARPVKDRRMYENAQSLPSNIYLTDNLNNARGIASELKGQDVVRDVWQVFIEPKYLTKTLDMPGEKQYHTVGGSTVPIHRISIVDYGE